MSDAGPKLGTETKPAWVEAKALWRRFEAGQETSQTDFDIHLAVAASFTANTLRQFIGAPLLSAGCRPGISIAPYNQLFQACLDPKTHFGPRCGTVVLLWRIEDLMSDELDGFLNGDASSLRRAADKLSSFTGAIADLRSHFAGAVIVSVPPLPMAAGAGPASLDNPTRLGRFHRAIVNHFVEAVEDLDHVRLL